MLPGLELLSFIDISSWFAFRRANASIVTFSVLHAVAATFSSFNV